MTSHDEDPSQAEVLGLPNDYDPRLEEPDPTPPGRLHGIFITGMALSALVGIVSMLAFITVGWPDNIARVIIILFFASAIVFLACASAAVFSAARDTYPNRGSRP